MTEKILNIPRRIKNPTVGGYVTGAVDIIDDDLLKNQSTINAEILEALSDGGSVDKKIAVAVSIEQSRAQDVEESKADKSNTYTKQEVDNIASAFISQKYVTVEAESGESWSDIEAKITATGGGEAIDTIYRIGKWDGSAYDADVYSEYTWNGSTYIPLDVKDISIDDEPTIGSDNLVKSGGVWQIPKFLFAENCPFIKELYITQEGIDAGINLANNIYSDFIRFAKDSSTFSGSTIPSENSGINKIYYFDGSLIDTTRVLGFIIVDWEAIPLEPIDGNIIFDIAKNIHYSPSIEADLIRSKTDIIQSDLSTFEIEVLGSDTAVKDYSLLGAVYNGDDYIYIQYPKDYKVKKVNQIKYKVLTGGAIKFYKVTITGSTASFQLIATETNTQGDGTIKTLPINELTLADNEYIGFSGFFYFGIDDNAQGFRGTNVNVSSGAVGSDSVIALAYDVEYSEALSTKIENIEGRLKEGNVSAYGTTVGGSIVSSYDNIVTLASDGSGDFTTFADAHNACISATGKTVMVIMPGIYEIDAEHSGLGYNISYDIKGVGEVTLKCIYEGENTDIRVEYSPFNMIERSQEHRTTIIEGIKLIASRVRYCVHDECGSLIAPSYTHIFRNCKFVHLTAPDSVWSMPRCIGGGLGNNGLIIIDNCEFQSEIATSVDYHGGYDGGATPSKILITNCMLVKNTVSCTTISLQSQKSVMVVKDCVLNAAPILNDYNGRVDVDLIDLNNIIL